jgi:hypothetical protein
LQAEAEWRAALSETGSDAATTRDLLTSAAAGPIDDARLAALRHEADTVAAGLAGLAARAPDEAGRTRTKDAEDALRSYMLAIETEQLLRRQVATDDALADANVARRGRAAELDTALGALAELGDSPPAPGN